MGFGVAMAGVRVVGVALSLSLALVTDLGADEGVDYRHHAAPIPAFARMYRTACSTCHIAAPKLNVLGEAFRLNGYEMPQSQLLVRADEPIALGAEPWRDAWPRAIWPGELPGVLPLAFRIQSDIAARSGAHDPAVTYRFPHEVYLLAGGPLGGGASAFLEMEWSQSSGFKVNQAKVGFRDVLPGVAPRALDLALGFLNPFLLTFTDRQTDRAGRQKFAWQEFRLAQMEVDQGDGRRSASSDPTVLGTGMPAVEVNGIVEGRLHWGVGLAQGGGDGTVDRNGHKDPYYRIRYKSGGMDFLGGYGEGDGPVPSAGGQLLDRSFVLEHFGYFGNESTPEAPSGGHRAVGFALRRLQGPWDIGVGHVRRHYDRPFGGRGGAVDARSWFTKGEFLVYPWLIASLKYDRLTVLESTGIPASGPALLPGDREALMPGLIALIRQNIRAVVEGELLLDGDRSALESGHRPHTLWLRLDIAF